MNDIILEWQSSVSVIIFHSIEARILMLPNEHDWLLPSIQLEGRLWVHNASKITQELRRKWGIDTTVLYSPDFRVDETISHQINAIYVMENHSPAWIPPLGGQWIGRSALADLHLSVPEQRAIIEACLLEADEHMLPTFRAPWTQRGWFASAMAWSAMQLTQMGYSVSAPVEQVRSWGLSCIARIPTARGDVYFKAGITPLSGKQARPLLFAHEPVLTRTLANMFPNHIAAPLAIERDQNWMLLEDFGPTLYQRPDIREWEEALRTFAQMQIASAAHIDILLAAGCLDRRLDTLVMQIDPLLNDTDALSDAGLHPPEIRQLQAYAPRLKAMCEQLAGYQVPQMLVHGDLHTGNIAGQQGRLIFFDWSDGCISHPFFDLLAFWGNLDVLTEIPEARMRLQNAYLAQWTAYEPMERLREAAALAEKLAAVHHAVSYQHLLANLEGTTRKQLRTGLLFLRGLL